MSGMPFGQDSILGKQFSGAAPQAAAPGSKEKVPAYVTPEVMNRLRNAVVHMQGLAALDDDVEAPLSLSAYVEEAIVEKLSRDERLYNNGNPFKQRRLKNLKSGPPSTK
ncbi:MULTISPECIES: hypothetical protein [unclassified Streptomyces]|uniref:hypothetical protein n=1 Tax=unclassified Streptomyces TaxID=2593676 RepID=UPI00093BB768|nr:hypothetical protein [Streptomyces sp. CB02115]